MYSIVYMHIEVIIIWSKCTYNTKYVKQKTVERKDLCMAFIDYKEIGTRIRKIRKKRNITQEQLAEYVGVGTTHISHIETGNTIPSLKIFIEIVNVLECTCDELLYGEIKKVGPLFDKEVEEYVNICDPGDVKLISNVVKVLALELENRKKDV